MVFSVEVFNLKTSEFSTLKSSKSSQRFRDSKVEVQNELRVDICKFECKRNLTCRFDMVEHNMFEFIRMTFGCSA